MVYTGQKILSGITSRQDQKTVLRQTEKKLCLRTDDLVNIQKKYLKNGFMRQLWN
jgi:hypothetical protein